jgi:Phage tail lysozyme/Putative peptidoglycan binding domain
MTNSLFQTKSPGIMKKLMSDFDLDVDASAAILGNLGHESGGFLLMQEQKPLKGGRGGYGWAQWTGPRRRQFEQWAHEHNLPLDSDEANYGFLKHELSSSEAKAIVALRETSTLEGGVRAFEQNFERAGVKHYASRDRYAHLARDAFLRTRHNGNGFAHDADEPVSTKDWQFPISIAMPGWALSFGARGPQVKALQDALAELDYPVGNRDGIFGGFTRAAVLAFQADNGLLTSGEVDQPTWQAMSTAAPRPLSRERIGITPKELERLGSTIVADGLRTKGLGWVTGILGMLGLTTGMAVDLAGSDPKPAPITPDAALPILEKLGSTVANMGTGKNATAAKSLIDQLHTVLAPSAVPIDHSTVANGFEPIVRDVLPVAASVLPGFPGSLLVLGLGVAAHLLGNRVVKARTKNHQNGSNLGR